MTTSSSMASKFSVSTAVQHVNLRFVLTGGQSFRWKETSENVFEGVAMRTAWRLSANSGKNEIEVEVLGSNNKQIEANPESAKSIIRNYLSLDIDLNFLSIEWAEADQRIAELLPKMHGIRILSQDPVENLFSFICSSNNNISRISKMVEAICSSFGDPIETTQKSEAERSQDIFYDFPSPEKLAAPKAEAKLRTLGLGYRAKYIHQTAKRLCELFEKSTTPAPDSGKSGKSEQGSELLESTDNREKVLETSDNDVSSFLRLQYGAPGCSYADAHKMLQDFPGVGAKVSDCVCLMSLGHSGAVPIDTHVWTLTARFYMPHLRKGRSLNAALYREIGDFYRAKFGAYAGWAHDILFCAELKRFGQEISDKDQPVVKRKR